jgi:hypothetical protein
MSRAARLQKQEHRLKQLERDYVVLLNRALHECRAGTWGLFGQNDHVLKLDSPADTLLTIGDSIRQLRQELGIVASFAPHSRYMNYRNLRGPNAPGEPTLAEALSQELRADPSALAIE